MAAVRFPPRTSWGTAGDDPLGDLETLALDVRRDGKSQSSRLVFGRAAWKSFIDNAAVQARLDNRTMTVGMIAPETRGQSATFQGWVWIGTTGSRCGPTSPGTSTRRRAY